MTVSEQRSAREAERDFLLRSLDDLDNERAAGNIDDATYERLHADYTARAAAVLRELRDGIDVALPVAPRPSNRRRLLALGFIAVFALTLTTLLVQSVHRRDPGGSATGNDQTNVATLAEAVKDRPNDYNARIAYARSLLNNDLKEAVVQYDIAARLNPRAPEPVAYSGWIDALVAGQLKPGDKDRALLLDRANERFARAIEIDPGYEDTYVFRGITKFRVLGDPQGAILDFGRFLRLAPQDHPQRQLVLSTLAQAVRASQAQAQSRASTPTTTTKP